MPKEDAGAAQPIVDVLGKIGIGKKKQDSPSAAPPAKQDTSWHDDQVKAANEAFRKKAEEQRKTQPAQPKASVPSYKKGGKIKKTGLALLHKGEKVVPKSKAKKVDKLMRKRG